jgi:rare lipoprotein A
MKSIVRGGVLAGAVLMLAGCGSFDGKRDGGPTAGPAPAPAETLAPDRPVKIGAPYAVDGVTYTPADIADYDEVGYASWYGDELAGKPTANGETFDPAAITAAHKTLPLPSYVEVTALDTGRTILVRVNDRGPMANDRLIDLSRGAAEQLGLKPGVAGGRVRRTNPPMAERAQLRAGKAVPVRLATPGSLLAILRSKLTGKPSPAAIAAGVAKPGKPVATPPRTKPGDDRFIVEGGKAPPTASAPPKPSPAPAPAPAATSGSYAVQVATFSTEARANTTAKLVGGSVSKAGNLWRVRMGPFAGEAEAKAALGKAHAKGFRDAVITRDR